jgi:signal transduction histidine kinase
MVPVMLPFFLGAATALPLSLMGMRRWRYAQEIAARVHATAHEAEQRAVRRLRLAAHDLRGIGMTLHGHADTLDEVGHLQAGIALAATDVLDMADELQDHSSQPTAPRALHDEMLELGETLDEAIAGRVALLGPGRRHWRIAPGVGQTRLRGDPRALRHVLSRVLADAVRTTRQDDWIDITLESRAGALALVIADEGAGLVAGAPMAAPDVAAATSDSRGIGLRLATARGLMELHGGRLEIEAHRGVGTRVALVFPADRVWLPPRLWTEVLRSAARHAHVP